MSLPTGEPSVERMALLLTGSLSAAVGALVEMRDLGFQRGPVLDGLVSTFNVASQASNKLLGWLNAQPDVVVNHPEAAPVFEAVLLLQGEYERLSAVAEERARAVSEMDMRFFDITERLKKDWQSDVG